MDSPLGLAQARHINGRLAGAVAVSGATSIQDHQIAARAAAAGGLREPGPETR